MSAHAARMSAGNITTNGTVSFDSNGTPSIDGFISAKGQIKLNQNGGGTGTVGGTVTSTLGAAGTVVDVAANATSPGWITGAVDAGRRYARPSSTRRSLG